MRRAWACWVLCAFALGLTGCKGDPKTPEYWEKAVSSAHHTKDRVRVLDDLRESGNLSPAFLPLLHAHLTSERNAEVKGAIAKLLGVLKSPSSVDPLINAIDLGNADSAGNAMNKEIAGALARIGDPRAIPNLLQLMKSRDNYVRIEAINALGTLKAGEAVEPLMQVALDESGEPFISKKAVQALGDIAKPAAVPTLVKMMFKERRGVSFYMEASFALFQVGKPAADALVALVKGEDKPTFNWLKDAGIIEPAIYAKSAQVLGDLYDARAESALVSQLNFNSEYLDLKLFVRMKAADALGRLRAKDAVKPLSGLLEEGEATARTEYTRALTDIGGRDAIPALEKSAQKGSWDARVSAITALTMLGDEREQSAIADYLKTEDKLTRAECKDNEDYAGCKKPEELVKKHTDVISALSKRLAAAQECKADGACWAKKLDDPDAGVRSRAALELGRSGKPEALTALLGHLKDTDLDARSAIIQGADWLVMDSKDAAKAAKASLPAIDQQLEAEHSKTEFVKVNEDLRRLAIDLRRA